MANSLLVTGAAGFIGANFVHYWMRQHPADKVVAYDALTYAGNRANLDVLRDNPKFSFVHADICDYPRVLQTLRDNGIDTIVHFAAESHVDRSITGPDAFIETNVVGTHSLLKAAREAWLSGGKSQPHRFHHVSTDEVYGSLSKTAPAFHEQQKYEPNSPYSASKAASDHLVRAYHHTFGLEVTTSNCSNNYGPYQYPEKLIPLFLLNALHGLVAGGGDLRGHVFFVDTLKKFADLMNKGGSREFFRLMRGLTVRGCTAVLNGHTNKHRGPDGKLIFEGVGDVRNDVDELIYIEATDKDAQGTVTINMVPDKVRCMARELSLRYHTESRELQVLPGVVNVAAIAARQRQLKADASVISNVLVVLRRHGGMNFTELAEQVAIASGIGRNAARVVIERYASEDVGNTEALWMDTRIRTAKNARRISLRPIDGTVQ